MLVTELNRSLGFTPSLSPESVLDQMGKYQRDSATKIRHQEEHIRSLMKKLAKLNIEREALLERPLTCSKQDLIQCIDLIKFVQCEIQVAKEHLERLSTELV